MFDGMADWMSVPFLHWTYAGRDTKRHGMAHAAIYPYEAFRCRDGEIVIAIQQPAEWRRFAVNVLKDRALADDPRFADNPSRLANRQELAAAISAVFGAMDCAALVALLDTHAIAWGRVSDVPHLARHGALRLLDVPFGNGGTIAMPRPAGRGDLVSGPVPRRGEDTDMIRAEFAA